jgi:hypothetical protein
MLRQVKQIAIAIVAMAAIAAPASAVTVIDFATGNSGVGGLVFADGSNVIGEAIPIGNATVSGAPMGNGDYQVFGPAGSSVPGFFGSLDFNTGTGDISITGCIPGLGVGVGACDDTILLEGTITAFENVFGLNRIVALIGNDTKHADLLAAIGLEPGTPFLLTGAVQTGLPFGQGRENGQPSVSTDIADSELAPIPEPATMMLLGTGLLAAFRARRNAA